MTPYNRSPRRVLIVDDDEAVSRLFRRFLASEGYEVGTASDGEKATRTLDTNAFDVIVSDISMPGMDGIELLRRVRERDVDVPVILVTGEPEIDTAIRAVELGAFRYLRKPVRGRELLEVVGTAVHLHDLAKLKREALALVGQRVREISDTTKLKESFERALRRMWIAYQPIVSVSARKICAYEAFVRSRHAAFGEPPALLDAADRLDSLYELGRRVRGRVAEVIPSLVNDAAIFVNLHPADLEDERLYDPDAPLSRVSSRVVLEITERARLEPVAGLAGRLQTLRRMGYRLAVDDLGAGYSGLNSFVLLHPDVVKIDMTLIHGVDEDPRRQQLIGSMVASCRKLGVQVIVEGVETREEAAVLASLGADLQQGYLFAPPAAPFPAARYGAFEASSKRTTAKREPAPEPEDAIDSGFFHRDGPHGK